MASPRVGAPSHEPSLLRRYLLPRRRQVTLLGVLLFASVGLQLASPQILQRFIDTAVGGGALADLTTIALVFLTAAVLGQLVSIAETYVAENLGMATTNALRTDLTRHCLGLDLSFHGSHTPGELIERVDGDVATLSNFFSRFVVQLVGNGLLLLGVLILLFRIDWRIGLVIAGFTTGALLLVNRLRNLAVPYWAVARQKNADLFGFLEERLAGTEDLRSSGATAYALHRLSERHYDLLREQIKASLIGTFGFSAPTAMLGILTVIALALGTLLYQAGEATIGTVYLIFSYTTLLSRPIDQISRQIQDLQKANASLGRVRALFKVQSSLPRGRDHALPRGALSVEFDGVSFAYEAAEPVLRDVSFCLQPGQVLGILGRTGGGKTTLARLLLRLYDPTRGVIRVGGVDLRDAQTSDLRGRIGTVTQDTQLFRASVRDNLTLFDDEIPDERVMDALAQLGLVSWCQALPNGLATLLAAGGGGLSAGEAQLLALARVFLRDPGLIILDEASSRLDPATEQRLERALDRLLGGRTAIIIAHRLATIRRVDLILILEEGRAVEFGRRDDLARDPGSRLSRYLQVGLEEVRV